MVDDANRQKWINMKKMLINATQTEELRVAIVEAHNQSLLDIIVDRQSYRTKAGNIYLGKVTSVEPSLDAVFVNFGSERHGFLPLKEISRDYFEKSTSERYDRTNIRELIKEGQPLMVQVEKEERGNKGAALTTFVSLAGSYLVLMPNNPRAGGISRRVEGEERDELREILSHLPLPEDMGIIIRTAGVGKSAEELEWDLKNLLRQWEAIKQASLERDPPFLIHQESDIVTRIIRDYLREDFVEIIIDQKELFDKVRKHLEHVRPTFVERVKYYDSNVPIFNHYQIEQKIESAYLREVRLPSGGSIVIDHTEALVAVDVNSARSTRGSDIEDTALTTNMEAAEEIARQLRLRDIGGLIVIDFIDMSSMRNRREVENQLRNALKLDKARTQIGNVSSRFGLLEMSRQRLRHSLGEATQVVCPRCSGWGTIRSIESLALSIIRMIEEDAVKQNTAQIQVQLPVDITTFIINEKRELILHIEKTHNVEVFVIPNPNLESPHYHIKRLSQNEISKTGKHKASYVFVEKTDTNTLYKKTEAVSLEEKPAVEHIIPEQPAPTKKPANNLIKRLITGLFGATEEANLDTKSTTTSVTSTATRSSTSSSRAETHHRHAHHNKPQRHISKGKSHQSSTATRHKDKDKVVVAAAPTVTVEKKEEQPPLVISVENAEKSKRPDPKSRTRRGSRGGRRRHPGADHKKTMDAGVSTLEPPKDETPPTHLPPFPTDLEQYYKQNLDSVRKPSIKSEEEIKKTPVPEAPKNLEELVKKQIEEKGIEAHEKPVVIVPVKPTEPTTPETEKTSKKDVSEKE